MESRVLQDWTTVSSSLSPFSFTQGMIGWAATDEYQDAGFLVEVLQATSSSLLLQLETAPAAESKLFAALNSTIDLVPLIGSSAVVTSIASATAGPPISSYVRWAIYGSSSWTACFRITMFAL